MKLINFRQDSWAEISSVFFLLSMGLRSFTAPYENAGILSLLKYIICVIGLFCLYKSKDKSKNELFLSEYKSAVFLIVAVIILSIFYVLKNGNYTSRLIMELIYLIVPPLYAYYYVNSIPLDVIYNNMVIALIMFFAGYIINLGMSIGAVLSSLSYISFDNSYSPFESSCYAAPSTTMACFFLFYRKKKWPLILSVVFVLMTFKRLSVLFVLFMFFLPKFFNVKKAPNISTIRFIKVIFFIFIILYYKILIPGHSHFIERLLNINLDKLTMGRAWRFSLLYNSDYMRSGLGATYSYMNNTYGFALEMDFMRLVYEIGFIGTALFVNHFFNIVKKSRYCLLVMVFMCFNLLMSHSLADMFGWLLLYITFGCVQYKTEINENSA